MIEENDRREHNLFYMSNFHLVLEEAQFIIFHAFRS